MFTRADKHKRASFTVTAAATEGPSLAIPLGMRVCLLEAPSITSATITLEISHDEGTTFVGLYNVDNTQQGRTTAGTGSIAVPFILYGRPTHCRVKLSASSAGATTWQISFSA